MKAFDFWQLFLDTGAPEAYLMYKSKKMEGRYVPDDSGDSPAYNGLQ